MCCVVIWTSGCRPVLTGWLKGFGSEGRMCRWVIMAWSRSLSFASCKTQNRNKILFISLNYPQTDLIRCWHRITNTITPQAKWRTWERGAPAPAAPSHTLPLALKTRSPPFDFVSGCLMGYRSSLWRRWGLYQCKLFSFFGSHVKITCPHPEKQPQQLTPTLLRCVSLQEYENNGQNACPMSGCALWGVGAVGAVGVLWTTERWSGMSRSERGRRGCPDVMWHQLPLCHFAFSGCGFRGSAKRCLPLLQTQKLTRKLDSKHTHTVLCTTVIKLVHSWVVLTFCRALNLTLLHDKLVTALPGSVQPLTAERKLLHEAIYVWKILYLHTLSANIFYGKRVAKFQLKSRAR